MRIRRRDGTMAEVDDSYILPTARRWWSSWRSWMRGGMVHDGNGHPAGQRPGFLYSDANEQAEQARADAYRAV